MQNVATSAVSLLGRQAPQVAFTRLLVGWSCGIIHWSRCKVREEGIEESLIAAAKGPLQCEVKMLLNTIMEPMATWLLFQPCNLSPS